MRITISGTPGSGKSTVAKMLAERLGYAYVNAGQIFREAAAKRRMTLAQFNAHVATHPELDRKLDDALIARAKRHPNLILEGRLAGWMTKRAGLPAFRVWVTARESTRIDRLMARDGGTHTEVIQKLKTRSVGERRRYRRQYDIDLDDLSFYDMVIKTDNVTPEQIVRQILAAIETK